MKRAKYHKQKRCWVQTQTETKAIIFPAVPKFLLYQAASPPASHSKRASGRAVAGPVAGPVSPMSASRAVTYHTVQLRAVWIVVLEVFHCFLDFVHAIQVLLQPPSGAKNKSKNKKDQWKKNTKSAAGQTQDENNTEKFNHFLSSLKEFMNSLLLPLSATAEQPSHAASTEVLMYEHPRRRAITSPRD